MPSDTLGRRAFLTASLGTAAAATVPLALGGLTAPAAAETPGVEDQNLAATVRPGDRRYTELSRGNNQRFVAQPDYIRLIGSSRDAELALSAALSAGKRISLRSGGHCFADFVCNPDVEVILDLSPLNRVGYDPALRAFYVEPGARLLNIYEELYKGWGVTVPGGICWSVGAGGHIAGGGYGLLSRAHGLIVDHLYAVEVVTVDAHKRVRTVRVTRDDRGALGDLFWAHTGGGGGNFGIVTKYWFRSPGAHGRNPADQLITAPSQVYVSSIAFDWAELDQAGFTRLVNNFGAWHEKYKAPGTPESNLSSLFNVSHKAHGSLGMFTQIDAAAPKARQVLDDYLAAITEGVPVTPHPAVVPHGELPAMPELFEPRLLPWLQASRLVGTNNPTITNPTSRGAHKSAYLNRSFEPAQIEVLYQQMTRSDFTNPDTMLVLFSFGGQVNAVPETATANAQRQSAFKMCLQTFWESADDDEFYLSWERETYEGMFAATGGVPVPGGQADGCYINYPDVDVADPAHNRSKVGYGELYYKQNYPRLQQVKRQWDPTNYFTHHLGVQPS